MINVFVRSLNEKKDIFFKKIKEMKSSSKLNTIIYFWYKNIKLK